MTQYRTAYTQWVQVSPDFGGIGAGVQAAYNASTLLGDSVLWIILFYLLGLLRWPR